MRLNVYCDESSHLLQDPSPSMVLGCTWCDAETVADLSAAIRDMKAAHGLSRSYEAKWTKVSVGQASFYRALVDFFFAQEGLSFRAVLIPDKSALRHEDFGQTHDEWYYKMYYVLLNYLVEQSPPDSAFAIYLDIKDTHTPQRARVLHEVLCNHLHDFDCQRVVRIQPVRSHEVELLQLADVLMGAIAAAERGTTTSAAKLALMRYVEESTGQSLVATTGHAKKFNMLRWQPRGV